MNCRQAKKIRRAAIAYSGGYPHRHRKPTIIAAMRKIVWRGWRWSIDFGAMARYAMKARAGK